jgi:hypothetical protein
LLGWKVNYLRKSRRKFPAATLAVGKFAMRSIRLWLGVAVLIGAAYGAYELIPVYMSAYEFEDAIKEEAKLAVYSQKTDDQIHDSVMKKAAEFQIPVKSDQVKVLHNGSDLTISADYVIHIDVPVYPFDLTFHPSSNGHRIAGV